MRVYQTDRKTSGSVSFQNCFLLEQSGFYNSQNATFRKIGVRPFPSHTLCQTCTLDGRVFCELKQLYSDIFLMDMLPLSSVLLELTVKPCSKRGFRS